MIEVINNSIDCEKCDIKIKYDQVDVIKLKGKAYIQCPLCGEMLSLDS